MTREAILTELATRVGASRAPWPAIPANQPFTLLADGQESVSTRDYDVDTISMTVGIHRSGRASTDATRSTEANALLAALVGEALGTDPTLGGLCQSIRYLEGSTEYPREGTDLIGATAMFQIDYDSPY